MIGGKILAVLGGDTFTVLGWKIFAALGDTFTVLGGKIFAALGGDTFTV